jgi:hypothetical protein
MSPTSVRKHRIGGRIFAELSRDAVFQQSYGVQYGAEYITDSNLEAEYLAKVYRRDDVGRGVATLLNLMKQQVPLLSELPIRRVISIRRSEHDAFLLYRNALSSTVKQYLKPGNGLSQTEAAQIYSDVIAPQLLKLKVKVAARKRSAGRRSLAKVIAPFAAVGIGMITGLIPAQLKEIFRAAGVATATQIAEVLTSMEKHPAEVHSNNFYFLFRLSRE